MDVATRLLTSLAATFGAYGAYKVLALFYGNWTSPLRVLPGPPSESFIYGNFKEIWDVEAAVAHEKWTTEYGTTITYRALFGMRRLYTTDLKAITHILTNNHIYEKPEPSRYALSRITGEGVLTAEGETHRNQRRIMNPGFGPAQIRELTGIFIEKSLELRDALMGEAENLGEGANINILSWLSRMTLDVIGLAGFSYKFDSLQGGEGSSELNSAFAKIFESNTRMSIMNLLPGFIPALRFLPTDRDGDTKRARATMDKIARELLRTSKAELQKGGNLEKDSLKDRDLLTLLLRANMATDIPENQRMSDEDVLSQIPTFLVAGHETTSTATTWALYALCCAPETQKKLRDELLTVSTDNPTMDELNALSYLDAVVRETLRIHSPVTATMRMAVKDDIIPLDAPFTDIYGKEHSAIFVKKGQTMMVPILHINRTKSIWGEDGHEFKPERWSSVPEAAGAIPGVWGNMLTFLGGQRSCIGYRFSLVEMKALLFTLIRAFEFELAVPIEDIGKKSTIVQRPFLRSNPKAGNQMPLILKPYIRS